MLVVMSYDYTLQKKINNIFFTQNKTTFLGDIQVLRNAIFLEIGPPPTPS